MKFRIGNDIQLGGNSKYQISPGIEGLTAPDIRNGDGLYAGVDGGYMSSQLYGFRTITIKGFYITDTCETSDSVRLNLMTKLHIRYLYPIFITTFSGKHYFTEGYITDIKADIEGPRAGEYQITILCPDPLIYDGGDGVNADSAWLEQTFHKEVAGGFDIEYTTPVQWRAGEMTSLIMNNGSVNTYPIITLRGVYTNPTITNMTTGQMVKINRTINAGEEVTIDMKQRVITLLDNSQTVISIASDRDEQSYWWSLAPGENKIVLSTDSTEDTAYGIIKFRQGFPGI